MGRQHRRQWRSRGWIFAIIALVLVGEALRMALILVATLTQLAFALVSLILLAIAAWFIARRGARAIAAGAGRLLGIRWADLPEYHALKQQTDHELKQLHEHFSGLSVESDDFDEAAVRLVEVQNRRPQPPRWAFWLKER